VDGVFWDAADDVPGAETEAADEVEAAVVFRAAVCGEFRFAGEPWAFFCGDPEVERLRAGEW